MTKVIYEDDRFIVMEKGGGGADSKAPLNPVTVNDLAARLSGQMAPNRGRPDFSTAKSWDGSVEEIEASITKPQVGAPK